MLDRKAAQMGCQCRWPQSFLILARARESGACRCDGIYSRLAFNKVHVGGIQSTDTSSQGPMPKASRGSYPIGWAHKLRLPVAGHSPAVGVSALGISQHVHFAHVLWPF